MSFFNDNDIKAVKQAIDNENAKKEQEALNRKIYAQKHTNNVMKTFLLYKEAAKEYPDICRSLGIKPFSAKEEGFFGKTYHLYSLLCSSIDSDSRHSTKTVGVTQNGDLVEFKKTNQKYTSNEGYKHYYIVRSFPEYDLERRLLNFFSGYSCENDKIEFTENVIGLLPRLLLFSFPGSCRDISGDYLSRYCVKCDASNPKSKEEVRESIKKYFLQMAKDSISLKDYEYYRWPFFEL